MIIQIQKELILEISALKGRQMSLQAGIIPDHNTNWKGALKKVRGARGELTSGKELNQIKQKMIFSVDKLEDFQRRFGNSIQFIEDNSDDTLRNIFNGNIWIKQNFDWNGYK